MTKPKKVQSDKFVSQDKVGNEGITYQTVGTTLQALSVQLDEGEHIYSEAGKMSWMTSNVKMSTHGQGCSKMFSRFFSNESIFVNKFTCEKGTGVVSFTTDQAGKLIPLELNENTPGVVFQRGAYLCSEEGVDRKVEFVKRLGAGLFGGKGFMLQKVEGNGKVHLVADGEVAMFELKEGQEIAVDQGNLVAYEDTVDYDIKTISGPKNWFFGGEGVFTALLRGPGRVWLQTRKMNLTSRMRSYNANYARRSSGPIGRIIGFIIGLGTFGCVLASIIISTFAS